MLAVTDTVKFAALRRRPDAHGAYGEFLIFSNLKFFNPNSVPFSRIVIATADAVAADAAGLCVMKHYLAQIGQADPQIDNYTVWTQPQMVRALALNNGWISGKQQYSCGSQGIDEIETIMQYLNA